MKKPKLNIGNYFDVETIESFSSGCTLLDLVLGPGGWAENRIANLVGDKSTDKTGLAIEACAGFRRKHPNGRIVFVEAEAAFDRGYASQLGFPEDATVIDDVFTVEALFDLLTEKVAEAEVPTFVVVDSLDALSDEAEQDRDIRKGTFGQDKAKKLSEMFRRLVKKLHRSLVTILIVSQVRDNIGVTFGKTTKRAGGRALDFYASQVVWLAHIKRLDRTVKKTKRVIGIRVKAMCEKNKVGKPFRACEFPVYFGFGVEDVEANLAWLIEQGETSRLYDRADDAKSDLKNLRKLEDAEYDELAADCAKATRDAWRAIDDGFEITRRKYR